MDPELLAQLKKAAENGMGQKLMPATIAAGNNALAKLVLVFGIKSPEQLKLIAEQLTGSAAEITRLTRNRQTDYLNWGVKMFGPIALDPKERAARFLEEAAEAAQACGLDGERALNVLVRTFSRPPGEPAKEIGQAMITLFALAEAMDVNASDECDKEYDRVQTIPKEEWEARHNAKVAEGTASDNGKYIGLERNAE